MKYTITELNIDFEDDDFECPVLEQQKVIPRSGRPRVEADNLEALKSAVSVYTGFNVSHLKAAPNAPTDQPRAGSYHGKEGRHLPNQTSCQSGTQQPAGRLTLCL